jgi:hypothetical protein
MVLGVRLDNCVVGVDADADEAGLAFAFEVED